MNVEIIAPKNSLLKNFIQYFLFFRKVSDCKLSYTTFPNNNLCLAIYRNNKVEYKNSKDSNICNISQGNEVSVSRLYGFHKRAFQVNIQSRLDQISIIFQPAALRCFTEDSYKNLMADDDILNNLFNAKTYDFQELLFEKESSSQRAELLERFFLERIRTAKAFPKIKEMLHLISTVHLNRLTVERVSKILGVNESTLYRIFLNNFGQNPKTYFKTTRFRKALNEIVKNKSKHLTDVVYSNSFFDQSHFIKDFKIFTGYTPKELNKITSVAQRELIWISQKE